LANFYVRAGKIPEAIQTLRMVLLEDGTVARKVFTLATNATPDREAILEMLPPQAPIFFDYINFRIEKATSPALKRFGLVFSNGTCLLTCARLSPISMR